MANEKISAMPAVTLPVAEFAMACPVVVGGVNNKFVVPIYNGSAGVTTFGPITSTDEVDVATDNQSGSTNTGSATLGSGSQTGTGNSGDVFLFSGDAADGSTGQMGISTGNVAAGSGASGNFSASTGTSTGASGNLSFLSSNGGTGQSGDITFQTGNSSGARAGNISFTTGTGNAGANGNVSFNLTNQFILTGLPSSDPSVSNAIYEDSSGALRVSGTSPKTGKITGTFSADGTIGTVPAGAMIFAVVLQETAGHAVTVTLGTASGGAQVLGSTAIGSSGIVPINGPNLLLQAWVANQSIFIHSAAWGSANVKASVWFVQ